VPAFGGSCTPGGAPDLEQLALVQQVHVVIYIQHWREVPDECAVLLDDRSRCACGWGIIEHTT